MGGEDKGKRRAAVEMIEVQCQNFFKCGSVFPRPSGAPGLTAVLSVSPPSAALTSELELPPQTADTGSPLGVSVSVSSHAALDLFRQQV